MNFSRRRFLRSSFILTGMSILPPAILSSCLPAKGKMDLKTAFIGSRENFDNYLPYFRKLRRSKFMLSSLEATLAGDADIAFYDTGSMNTSTYILLLLEQGKDVFITYPLGYTLGEYAAVSDFMEKNGRMVGMLNPLMFYPSIQLLKETIAIEKVSISEIRINCHPDNLGKGFLVPGLTGSAQPLERVVSLISGYYPLQLQTKAEVEAEAEAKAEAEAGAGAEVEAEVGGSGMADGGDSPIGPDGIDDIKLSYESFTAYIHFDKTQSGWNMEIEGEDFIARTDHTGMLAVNSEVEPRLSPDPGVMEESILKNLEDFMKAVRERSQPEVNSLDGLASIVLNNAVEKSIKTGWVINL